MAPVSETVPEIRGWSPAGAIPGLADLWSQTRGDPHIRIAVLDGPVDLSHPSLRGADLTRIATLVPADADAGPACRHGTAVTSLIFGRHDSSLPGVAPRCRGFVVPIFQSADAVSFRPCSQLDLARALLQAVQLDVHLINISSGQFAPSAAAHPLLADAVRECVRRGILIVAAAGNDGCECLHVPAALGAVLAVGAMDARGEPLHSSNWGGPYQRQGILAPGLDIPAARPGGGGARHSGTSYATALATGVAALLLSLQYQQGRRPDPPAVRQALLRSAIGCAIQPAADCRRLLAGRLNVNGAISILTQGVSTMSESTTVQSNGLEPGSQNVVAASSAPAAPPPPPQPATSVTPSTGTAGGCSCKGAAPQLVYALGQIGYDFVSEARLDSYVQAIHGPTAVPVATRVRGIPADQLLGHLQQHPHAATPLEWTLTMHGHPVYAIKPLGPFAATIYEHLRRFLGEHLAANPEERTERVSIPGTIVGQSTLLTGQVVPLIMPELRGMFSWNTAALVNAVVGEAPAARAPREERVRHEQRRAAVRNFLDRVYHEVHNLGVLPQDRALNYAATNALTVSQIFEAAIRDEMELESIKVVPSAVCRPGSDCWDVEVYFFYPQRQVQTVRRLYRFTVDVSDVIPVTVGPVRTWFTR
jgi:hypothetical protein